jgi:hypothetical protein
MEFLIWDYPPTFSITQKNSGSTLQWKSWLYHGHTIWLKPRQLSRYSEWLRAGRPRDRSSNPGRVKNFLFSTSGAHPAYYPMGIGCSFSGGKEAWTWTWPLTSNYCRGQENVDLYIHSPLRLRGVVLNYLSGKTTLSYTIWFPEHQLRIPDVSSGFRNCNWKLRQQADSLTNSAWRCPPWRDSSYTVTNGCGYSHDRESRYRQETKTVYRACHEGCGESFGEGTSLYENDIRN